MLKSAIEHPLFEQLVAFRTTYPKQTIVYDGLHWKYHISGKGKPAMLLLPGGLGSGEAFFAHFMELASRYTVIVPYYGRAEEIGQLTDGIIAILDMKASTPFMCWANPSADLSRRRCFRRFRTGLIESFYPIQPPLLPTPQLLPAKNASPASAI